MSKIAVILGTATLLLVAVLSRWETSVIPVGYLVRTDRWTGTVWVTGAGKPTWHPVEEPTTAIPWEKFQPTALLLSSTNSETP
ncbi:MAG: hypothetical protein U1G08_14105 [Verrucomicrobiota bacterium]